MFRDEELPRNGDVLGDFVVRDFLGRGAVGAVFLAHQRSLGDRRIALKVISATTTTEVQRERFRREARIAAELHHPNLAEVYGFGIEDAWLYLAMELVEGPTLFEVLARLRRDAKLRAGPSTRRTVVRYGVDVASALDALHRTRLVHRDVKPSNVILRGGDLDGAALPSQPAVLVDLGLVRPQASGTITEPGQFAATIPYASPEQLNGYRLDARTDVFSLGATLHDLLTGRLPEERPQASTGLELLQHLVPGLDPDLSAVVGKACDPMPQWRYGNGSAVREELVAWLGGRSVSARHPPLSERVRRYVSQNPRAVLRSVKWVLSSIMLALAVAWVVQVFFAVEGAREAVRTGDLRALTSELGGVPSFLRVLVGIPDEVHAARLGELDDGGARARIQRHLEDLDEEAAIWETTVHLRVHGAESDPLIRRFFVRELRRTTRPTRSREPSLPMQLAARLFYERPSTSPADFSANEELLAALTDLWDEPLHAEDRLNLLTALSGSATSREVDDVLQWATERDRASEEQRLAILACERIIRRANQHGRAADIDFDFVFERLEHLSRELLASEPRQWVFAEGWSVDALFALGRAAELARRAAGGTRAEAENPLAAWSDALDPTNQLDRGALLWLAACRHPASAQFLEDSTEDPWIAELCGRMCALYGEPELTAATRGRLELPEVVEAFDVGHRIGEQERVGELPDHDLDEDSLLGAESKQSTTGEVDSWHEPRKGSVAVAGWTIQSCPLIHAQARGLAYEEVQAGKAGQLVLARFGESVVHLRFDVVESNGPIWSLVLDHLAAARTYYVDRGVVRLDIELDGRRIVNDLLITHESWHRSAIPLPSAHLRPGPHELVVRVNARSTTTYRLRGAFLHDTEFSPR